MRMGPIRTRVCWLLAETGANDFRGGQLYPCMSFDPTPDLSPTEVRERVDTMIEKEDVVLFMKGTEMMPQCGFSRRALGLIKQHRENVTTVNTLDALDAYREALEAHSGWETIPQTYVDGEFVGGSDILAELDERGDLEETLQT
jgi:monothiol glutaredoxin